MQGFILTHCQNRNVIGQYRIRRNRYICFSGALNTEDIDAELPADIDLSNTFSDPRPRHLHFKDGVLFVNLYVVENVVGSESDEVTPKS